MDGVLAISIHALLAESDGCPTAQVGSGQYFYPRSPCGERRAIGRRDKAGRDISIHALLAESDRHWQTGQSRTRQFLSTLSLRRATGCFIDNFFFCPGISIHALLAESDPGRGQGLCGRSAFLSTLSLRRATKYRLNVAPAQANFYPRSPCGERPKASQIAYRLYNISIHALLAESDLFYNNQCQGKRKFLSTLSLRRATAKVHKTVGYFCAYEINFMEITSSC